MAESVQGLLIDLDGTVYIGGDTIPGVKEALARLDQAGVPYRFVTNTTSKSRAVIVKRLASLDITVPPEHIFTAPAIAREYLLRQGYRRCFLLLPGPLLADLEGIESDEDDPQAIVLGDLGDDFTYNKLNQAFRFLMDGVPFVTLARNRYFRTPRGLNMDVGAFAVALEYASGAQAHLVGKPAPDFFLSALSSMDVQPSTAAMVGDDIEGDIGGAQGAGLCGILVCTGKTDQQKIDASRITPDVILNSLADLPEAILE